MLEVMKYHARCNRAVNAAMIEVLEGSDKAPYGIPIEGYYKSINAILDHYFIADTVWLKAFRQVRDSEIFANPLMAEDRKWEDRQFDELSAYKGARNELDGLIIAYIDELQDGDLGATISRKSRNGQSMEKLLWKSVVHMFNHDTHHRGQVSVILDQMGVENDYSNMIRYD
jgi:uncharacterized damage-inducible protein DinB